MRPEDRGEFHRQLVEWHDNLPWILRSTEPSGFILNITSSEDDLKARLELHFHGAGGTFGSAYINV